MRARLVPLALPLLAALLAAGLPAFAANESRVALVIGNAAYREAPLKNPANDAADIAAALKRLGFEVILRQNAGLAEMERAVGDFGKKLRQGGIGLFYFAGHGLQVKGENYLVPVDANIESEADVRFKCLNAGFVLGKMEDAGNQVNVVVLDACRNNPFSRSLRSAERGLAKMDAPKGSLIAYATAPGATAADGEGRNGVYTKHLLANLALPGVAVHDVFMRTRMGVLKETAEKQIPWESSSLTGYVYFVSAPQVQAKAPAQDPRAEAERRQLDEDRAKFEAARKEYERLATQRAEAERLAASRAEADRLAAERARIEAERAQMELERTRLASLQGVGAAPRPAAPAARVDEGFFVNTTWEANRSGGSPKIAYVRFEPGGKMAYSYKSPQEATHDGTDFWKVEAGRLTITWTNGYAYETYDLPGPAGSYQGSHTRAGSSTLTRLSGAPAPIPAQIGEAFFRGTVWKSVRRPDSNPPYTYVRFGEDHQVLYSNDTPQSLRPTTNRTSWRLSGNRLTIDWNNGFATETYDLPGPADSFRGSHTRAGPTVLERVR
jgi:uncharacterized caspase-like protein